LCEVTTYVWKIEFIASLQRILKLYEILNLLPGCFRKIVMAYSLWIAWKSKSTSFRFGHVIPHCLGDRAFFCRWTMHLCGTHPFESIGSHCTAIPSSVKTAGDFETPYLRPIL